jgi:hypothetical protein
MRNNRHYRVRSRRWAPRGWSPVPVARIRPPQAVSLLLTPRTFGLLLSAPDRSPGPAAGRGKPRTTYVPTWNLSVCLPEPPPFFAHSLFEPCFSARPPTSGDRTRSALHLGYPFASPSAPAPESKGRAGPPVASGHPERTGQWRRSGRLAGSTPGGRNGQIASVKDSLAD